MKRNRNWIWFFVVLVGLTAAAIAVEVWYNLSQQLDPARLAAARRLWQENGPRSYRVEYTIKRTDGSEQRYTAVVQEGQVASVPRGEYAFDRMDALFDHVEEQLRADAQPGGPRVFATAVFDRGNGHILRYIRSVRSPRERLEVTVRMRELPAQPSVKQPRSAGDS